MKNTLMKATILIAILLAGMRSAGINGVSVQLTYATGERSIPKYIQYEINGVSYRSDQIGYRMNQIAWEHMCIEDRIATMDAFGAMLNTRQEQFGFDFSGQMANFYDSQTGWAELSQKFNERLAAANFPEFTERFGTDRGKAYFERLFQPNAECLADIEKNSGYEELRYMYSAQKEAFSWAVEAYEAMVRYERLKRQLAVTSISGNLIQLICDKALVPNITMDGSSDLWVKMINNAAGAIADYVNGSTHIMDDAVSLVIDGTADAKAVRAALDKISELIDNDKAIIMTSIDTVKNIRTEIEKRHAEIKAALAARDKKAEEIDAAAFKSLYNVQLTGEPDPQVVKELDEQNDIVEAKYKDYLSTLDDEHSQAEKDAAQAAYGEAQAARESWRQAKYDALFDWFKRFRDHYAGTDWTGGELGGVAAELRAERNDIKDPLEVGSQGCDERGWPWLTYLNAVDHAEYDFAEYGELLTDDSVLAKIKASVRDYCDAVTANGQRCRQLNADIKDMVDSARGEYEAIITDFNALGIGENDERYKNLRGVGDRMMIALMRVAGVDAVPFGDSRLYDPSGYQHYYGKPGEIAIVSESSLDDEYREKLIADMQGDLDRYVAKREKAWGEIKSLNARYQDATLAYTWAVGEYNTAWRNLSALVANTPDYVKDLASYSWLPDFSLTELPKTGYMEGQTLIFQRLLKLDEADAIEGAKKIRDELNAYCNAYAEYVQRMDLMKEKVIYYWGVLTDCHHQMRLRVSWRTGVDYFKTYGSDLTPYDVLEGTFKEHDISEFSSLHPPELSASYVLAPNVAAPITPDEPKMPQNAMVLVTMAKLLQQDFNNRSQTHCRLMEAFVDLCDNENTYGTVIGEGFDDPFRRMCQSEFPQLNDVRGRGAHSYAAWLPGYYETVFAQEPDPYYDLVAPKAEEIAEVRANGGGPVNPTPPNPPTDPTESAPELYASPASTTFTGDANYNGWVRGADGAIAGLLTVKAGKAAKPEKGGQSKLTIQYTPFGGKKQTIKLDKSRFPVAGGTPTVNIPDLGAVTFGGTSLAGAGLQMGKDLAKSKDKAEKAAANARLARKDGTWTFAVGTDAGYAAFSVTVKKGKGKLTGTLPDGTKVSVSAQGILGDKALAIPFAYSKKGALGFVFWVNDDGTTSISDLTALKLANGTTLAVKEQVAPSAALKLADGTRTFTVSGIGVTQAFAVAGKKWTLPKHVKKPTEEKPDLNPSDVKLKFTEKTGVVKGTFSVPNPATGKAVKYTVNGVIIGGKLYGAAFVKGGTPIACEAK